MIKKGAALPLINSDLGDRHEWVDNNLMHENQLFSAPAVQSSLEMLLTDSKYAENMMKIKIAAVAAGGSDKAVKTVENYYINSLTQQKGETIPAHLFNVNHYNKVKSMSLMKYYCTLLFVFAAIIFLALFGFPGIYYGNFASHYSAEKNWTLSKPE